MAGNGQVDLEKAISLNLKYIRETPFAIGQLGDEVINSSNLSGVYRWCLLEGVKSFAGRNQLPIIFDVELVQQTTNGTISYR